TGSTAQEILGRHALDPVPTVRAVRPNLPRAVEQTIEKALAKHPADRFATASQFADALRTSGRRVRSRALAYSILVLAILLGGAVVASRLLRSAGGLPAEQSIAVLPFVNLSTDPENEYFSDGMTDDLINALTQVEGLRVPARTSSFTFKDKNVDVAEIGRQL